MGSSVKVSSYECMRAHVGFRRSHVHLIRIMGLILVSPGLFAQKSHRLPGHAEYFQSFLSFYCVLFTCQTDQSCLHQAIKKWQGKPKTASFRAGHPSNKMQTAPGNQLKHRYANSLQIAKHPDIKGQGCTS